MAKKIIVVDDETRIVELLSKILAREGFETFACTEGVEVLGLARKVAPDLIILDVMMPDMDGGEVQSALSNDHATRGIPVIFLTGAITEEEAVKRDAQATTHVTYLSKASDNREIVRVVKNVLGL